MKTSIGILALALAALPLVASAQNGNGQWNNRGNREGTTVSGQITRIDGTNVYVNSPNGQIRINDQPLWDNGRQDRQLVNGQNVTFNGRYRNGIFVASSVAYNGGGQAYNGNQGYNGNQSYNGNQGYNGNQPYNGGNNVQHNGSPYGCGSGQNQSCVAGQITRIDGKDVYLNGPNGQIRVYDQPLWDANRQDMRLVNGHNVTFGGYFTNNGTFVATRIVSEN